MPNGFRQLLAVIALALPVPGLAQPANLPDSRPRANDEQLRLALEGVRIRHRVPGLAAAVFDVETVRSFAAGELTPGGDPVTPESRFRIGQVSVLFAGLAAGALVADGSLSEDTGIPRIAPEIDLRNPWSGERPIRLGDLLSHRAGLGATHFRDVGADSEGQPLLAGINRAFRALRVEHRPGEREQYSIVGPAIAAYVVEKTAGMPYEELLSRTIFRPLDMTTTLGRADAAGNGDSNGHVGWPARRTEPRPLNFPAAGDAWLSAQDLARVGQLLLGRGSLEGADVLPAGAIEWLESSPQGVPELVPGSRRGVFAEESHGFLFYTQTGALPGFLARFAYSPELGKGYAVLLNRGDAEAALAAADELLRGQLLTGEQLPGAISPPREERLDVSQLAGWYRDVSTSHPPQALYRSWLGFAHAEPCEGGLCFSSPGSSTVLAAFDAQRLRERGHWTPGWQLSETGKGRLLRSASAQWEAVPGWQVVTRVVAGALVIAGLLLGVVLIPVWTWSLVRRRIADYHELVPRLLPLAAVLCVIALQIVMFTTDYPALGEVSAQTVTILVLSMLAPLLGVLALLAAIAGLLWKLPLRASVASFLMVFAANGAVIAMAAHGLIVFQAWNY